MNCRALQKGRHEAQIKLAEFHLRELVDLKVTVSGSTEILLSLQDRKAITLISTCDTPEQQSREGDKGQLAHISSGTSPIVISDCSALERSYQKLTKASKRQKHLLARFKTPRLLFMRSRLLELWGFKALSGWDFNIQTYNVVETNSPILQLAYMGDITGIENLFELGKASPFDRTEDGTTALDVRYDHSYCSHIARDNELTWNR
jgi:hypothetical protein